MKETSKNHFYVEAYYKLTSTYEQKGIRKLFHDFSKQKSNHQTSYHYDHLRMTFSEHINGLSFTITFNCGRKKQDKLYSKHQFILHIPQQSKHNSGEFHYEASKWYNINFQWVLGMQLIGAEGREYKKLFSMLNIPWQGF